MVGPLIRDQRARRELICAGLSRGHISDGLVPRTVEQPSVGEPIQQLLGGRLLAKRKQPQQRLSQVPERVDAQVLARRVRSVRNVPTWNRLALQ